MQSIKGIVAHDLPGRRWSRSALRVLLLVGLTLPQSSVATGQADERPQEPPVPSGEDVVAEGVATIPFDPIAWRVVHDTALDSGTAPFLERALGFAIASQGDLVITEQPGDRGVTVDEGEATFIPEAAVQQHASATDEGVPYLRIGLVPPVDAAYTAGAELVYAGEGFEAPEGERRLNLYRYELGEDDEVDIEDTGVPTLVVVTVGSVEVNARSGDPATLEAGEAAAFTGAFRLSNGGPEEAVAFVATIEEPETEPGQAAPDGTAQVRVFARGCPADEPDPGAEFEDFDAACREPIVGAEFLLTAGDQDIPQVTQRDIAAPIQGIAVWSDLAPGAISLTVADVPGYGPTTSFCGTDDDAGSPRPVQNLAFTVDGGETLSCQLFFHPGTAAGAEAGNGQATRNGRITIQMRDCPVGVAEDDLPAAKGRCAEDLDALQLVLLGDGIEGQRRNADWVPAVAGMAWTALPLGEYRIVFAPADAAVILSETDPDALGDWTANAAKTYPVTLTQANPEVILQVYVFSS